MYKVLKWFHRPFVWITILVFILLHPMLISMYVFLPMFIGIMGYILILGIEEKKISYVLIAMLYFINLEANLSLPFFLILTVVLLVYLIFYDYLKYFRTCTICKPIFSVILIDIFYLGALLGYDFAFQSTSIILDEILFYSLIVDILVVVIL